MNRDLEYSERELPEWITDTIARKMKYLEEIWGNLRTRKTGTKTYRRLEELEDDLVSRIVELGEVHPSYDPLWMVKAKEESLSNQSTSLWG